MLSDEQLSALSSQLSALSSQLSALSSQLSAPSSQLPAPSSQLSALSYFSLRQFTEPRVSMVLDSISTSKPLRNKYFSVSAEPLPTIDTP